MSSARSMRDGRGKAARAGPVVRERARSGARSNSGAAQQRRRRARAAHSAGIAMRGRIRALDGGTLTRCWQHADETATNTGSRHRTRHIDRRSRAGRRALRAHRARHGSRLRVAHACKCGTSCASRWQIPPCASASCSLRRKPRDSFAKAFRDHVPVANHSPKRRIAPAYWKTFADQPARREVMRRVVVAAVLCATALVAACSDDAPHDAQAADASQQAGASSGTASAFNSDAGAHAAAADAAPLAPPVVHFPPDDDDDAKPAADASAAAAPAAAASSPH
ncbi:hypothetical protein L0Z31_12420 (plasmid) [Burkholderia vietnamiensis]|nr:hypothetical protein [Burkholderia vietnamiensis]MCO1430755.1 hypothetical protein [Burkholderia vietnamiensis]